MRAGKRKSSGLQTVHGDKVRFQQFLNGFEEAEYVAGMISRKVGAGKWRYGDCAVLYRTNAQSRMFERNFFLQIFPYKIVGGINFYGRKETRMYWPT